MTAPQTATMTPSRSLAENLANAHISKSGEATNAQTHESSLPIITPQHQSATNNDSFALEKRNGYYVLPKCSLPPHEKYRPVEEFVARAIKSRLEAPGDANAMKTYKVILEAIRRKEDASLLHMVFLAIRTASNGSTLHHLSGNPTKHAHLLHVLLRFDPFTGNKEKDSEPFRNYSIADAYFQLVLALVSANSVFLVPSMTSMWKLLTAFNNTDPSTARTQRIHAALAAMTRLCPKGKTEIFPIVSANFPFRTQPEEQLVWCYRQVFAITGYVPSIQKNVLQFVIDKSLEMDVEIKIHDGGAVTLDDESDNSDDIFELELDAVKTPAKGEHDINVDEMADKLDALMLLTLQYLEETGQNDVNQARSLYERCLPAFESSILITHRSKFVQFILFYLCGLEKRALAASSSGNGHENQQHATLYREFCAALIGIIFDPYRSTVVRQCAACYLASFVSRSQFAEGDTICESLSALLQWAEAYITTLQANSISAADAREQCDLHLLFYTICQAAFYIMCFRGKEAVSFYRSVEEVANQPAESVPEHLQGVELQQVDISPTRWSHLCGHALQPLKYCLGTVHEEFLNVATSFNLLETSLAQRLTAEHQRQSSALRKKKATVIRTAATLQHARSTGGVGGLGRGSNPLDSFFPFDPYLLRRSHPFIEPFYRYWGEDDESDDESVDPMDDEDAAGSESSDDDSSSSDEEESRRQTASFDQTSMVSSTPPRSPAVLMAPREAWAETLKRSRAPSIEQEHGSW